MGEILQANNTNKEVMYAFRFMPSNKCVRLNQKQLDCIPYLAALVEHKDDFLSSQNENGEFVLHPPIDYTWFLAILHSIISEQPYSLFTELPEDENVLDTLQLCDYLGVNSFSSPLLKGEYLVLSNPTRNDNEKRRIEYHRANLSEARNTAAEFIIAIHKNEYNLLDFDIMETIFSLITVILSKPDVFSSRFRHHTFTIVKEYCFQFFPTKKNYELKITHHRTQKQRKLNSLMYLYDENNSLPDNFDSAFAWRGYYRPREENNTDLLSGNINIIFIGKLGVGKSSLISSLCGMYTTQENLLMYTRKKRWSTYYSSIDSFHGRYSMHLVDTPGLGIDQNHDGKELHGYQFKQKEKKMEAKSARSGCFNTLPKRPKINKFKHRCGPKAQKHR